MRKLLLGTAVVCAVAVPTWAAPAMAQAPGAPAPATPPAQDTPSAAKPEATTEAPAAPAEAMPSAEAIEAARALSDASGATATAMRALDVMSEQIVSQLVTMTGQDKPLVARLFNEVVMPEMRARMPELIQATALVSARHLSIEDMKAMTEFYRTPAGQRIVAATPSIAAESMTISMQLGQAIARDALVKHIDTLRARGLKI
ncbi:DUF2059 domain-containing protein [Acetobacteraceae bacterium H6797]|nr:DUF2059 domain-containing protein [Acetobacteraceae bacterium H6797]